MNNDFNITASTEQSTPQKKKGRKEKQPDVSPGTLYNLFCKWIGGFDEKVKERQRTDSKNTTVARHIKRLVRLLLQHIGSRCQYKSNEMNLFLRSYLKSFVQGFLPMFNLQDSDNKQELFLYYITLCFPLEKVTRILDRLQQQGFYT